MGIRFSAFPTQRCGLINAQKICNSKNVLFHNHAVLTPDGIIGKTIQVGKYSSLVQSISDNNFRLSVRIMPSGAVGILRWHNNSMCKIYEVQKNVDKKNSNN